MSLLFSRQTQTLPFYQRSESRSKDGKTRDPSSLWTPLMSSSLAFLEVILHPDHLPF